MSEFSSSFHIRTNSAPETERSLRKAKMSGIVFGPTNGWLTFVPYPQSDGLPDVNDRIGAATAIALATEKTVLQFEYAEDHLWSFALVKPDQSTATFVCEWDREPPGTHADFDRSALDGIAAVSLIEPFLVASREAEDGTPNAYGFAETLGLPAYRWLSPRYVERDTQRFINEGAREIGGKPAKPATTRLPPPTKLDLPKPDLTAREALAQLKPMLTWCRPPWTLRMVSGTSRQGWDFTYYNAELRETVQGYLRPNGNAGFRSLGRAPEPISQEELARRLADWRTDPKRADWVKDVEAKMSAPPIPTALPDQWLDSDEVLAIAETIECPEELSNTPLIRHLNLQCSRTPPARWRVTARYGTDAGHAPRWSATANRLQWTIELDAQTGKCLREVLSRPGEGRDSWIIRPWRERIDGGPWRDI